MTSRENIIVDAVLAAGKAMLTFDSSVLATQNKSTEADFVTAADLESERIIEERIHAAFPNDVIISEESNAGHELLTPERVAEFTGWVTDPLDGTNNFKHGMGYSAVSLAYIEKGVTILGAAYNPFRDELYLAQKGKGATRNGEIIHPSNVVEFNAGTRVSTSNSYEGGTIANLAAYSKLGYVWVDVLGCAVLIMTDVASGRLDLFHHNGLKPWDNAAAFLIAAEAGAKITDLNGLPTTWLTNEVVLGNPSLVDEFIKLTAV